MSKEDPFEIDGGPAFPENFAVKGNLLVKARTSHVHPGMSLRDYFAAQALLGLLSGGRDGDGEYQKAARDAYRYADMLLKEKDEKKKRQRRDFD